MRQIDSAVESKHELESKDLRFLDEKGQPQLPAVVLNVVNRGGGKLGKYDFLQYFKVKSGMARSLLNKLVCFWTERDLR